LVFSNKKNKQVVFFNSQLENNYKLREYLYLNEYLHVNFKLNCMKFQLNQINLKHEPIIQKYHKTDCIDVSFIVLYKRAGNHSSTQNQNSTRWIFCTYDSNSLEK